MTKAERAALDAKFMQSHGMTLAQYRQSKRIVNRWLERRIEKIEEAKQAKEGG